MNKDHGNRLGEAASSYLRSAQNQPVDWQQWGPEALAQAQAEDKPVLLDIGAVWCHWCHVMDHESYEDPTTAALINELFVPIKVDRDERPEVDARYQAAVAAISSQSGWPLTAFLTPEGKPYFGGTYFPAEERFGRPSFRRVLRSMADAFHRQRAEVAESADAVLVAVEQNETLSDSSHALDAGLLNRLVEGMLTQFDARNGGFGSQPKFPHAAALELLIDAASRGGPQAERAAEVVRLTLRRMAAGGIHDQLAGGFHRYSVDERWLVPHFEKMSYDNSELLRVYAHAFQSFADPALAAVAEGIVRWMDEWLSDREQGGFYASQNADVAPDDDGDYFTWTLAEAEAVLPAEELRVACEIFALRPTGHMQHNPAKNVLHLASDVPAVAALLGMEQAEVERLFESARKRMYASQLQRPMPSIDRTLYSGWNGLCISAYLAAGRALESQDAIQFALKSLDRVLSAAWRASEGLSRVVKYHGGVPVTQRIPAVLEDYAFVATAALDAWEVSGEFRYFEAACVLADFVLTHFSDPAEGGFLDIEQRPGEAALGALAARRKPLQDAPTPAGNPAMAAVLLRLAELTGEPRYREQGEATLRLFSGVVEHLGLAAASYAQALRRFLEPPIMVCAVGDGDTAIDLAKAAAEPFLLTKSSIRLRPEQLQELPPVLRRTLPQFPGVRQGDIAVVCRDGSCLPPAHDVDSLLRLLQTPKPDAPVNLPG